MRRFPFTFSEWRLTQNDAGEPLIKVSGLRPYHGDVSSLPMMPLDIIHETQKLHAEGLTDWLYANTIPHDVVTFIHRGDISPKMSDILLFFAIHNDDQAVLFKLRWW